MQGSRGTWAIRPLTKDAKGSLSSSHLEQRLQPAVSDIAPTLPAEFYDLFIVNVPAPLQPPVDPVSVHVPETVLLVKVPFICS